MSSYAQPPFAEGDIVAGRYRVERVIGQGGMGVVVVAVHVHLEQRFAIKFLLDTAGFDAAQTVRFFREARAAAQIKSEHVTRVVDTGTLENGAPYIVMEFLDGRDLANELAQRGPLPIAEAIDYVLQAGEAIAEAHALGIVHRDLKPANLFLAKRPDGSICVKVLDFGISNVMTAAAAEPALTATSAVMGSPLYMSPEQVRSSKTVDARSDVWSLGLILHELLAGSPPFEAETLPAVLAQIIADPPKRLRSVRPDAPPELENLILACWWTTRSSESAGTSSSVTPVTSEGPSDPAASVAPAAALAAQPSAAAIEPSAAPSASAVTPPASALPSPSATERAAAPATPRTATPAVRPRSTAAAPRPSASAATAPKPTATANLLGGRL